MKNWPPEVQKSLDRARDSKVKPGQEVELGHSPSLVCLQVLQVETTYQVVITPNMFRNKVNLYSKTNSSMTLAFSHSALWKRYLDQTTIIQGPVVQSVVSLMSSLRVISLTVLADSMYNILIFFAAKTTHIFSAKNFSILCITQCNF